MNKREALKAAAKAARLKISWQYPVDDDLYLLAQDPDVPRVRHYPCFIDADGFRVEWNPENSNRDSFGLLVALSVNLAVGNAAHPLSASSVSLPWGFSVTEQHNGDPEAATRLAVFLAAVEAGARLTDN